MVDIIYRLPLGRPITAAENDQNWSNMNQAVYEVTPFPTRAALVAAVQDGFSLPNGHVISAEGLVYRFETGATAIADLPGLVAADGWTVAHTNADRTGATDATAAFTAAANAAGGGQVRVPPGQYLINSNTASAVWILEPGAVITGLPPVGLGQFTPDTRRLTGRIFSAVNGTGNGFRLGDPDPWLERTAWRASESISELALLSSSGQIALTTSTRTSDNPGANMAAIGHESIVVNDNIVNPEPAWASFSVARRVSGAGATYGAESDFLNAGDTANLHPFNVLATNGSRTVGFWMTNGAGGGSEGQGSVGVGGNPISAAFAIAANPVPFDRGFVFTADSLGDKNEAVVMPHGYKVSWYDASGVEDSFIWGGQAQFTRRSDTASNGILWSFIRRLASGATRALDTVSRLSFLGFDGASNYLGGYAQVLQRTNFSGGNARFSYDIMARNAAGTELQVTLNGLSDGSFSPFPDNTIDLGNTSFRWKDLHAFRVRTHAVTVATLPTAASAGAGSRAFVTDATATTFASIVAGGGANGVPVYSDGTNWRIG